MTAKRFIAIASQVSYKPGWRITFAMSPHKVFVIVSVRAVVQDSYRPHHMITTNFGGIFRAAKYRSEKTVVACVKRVLFDAEDHEFAEHFKLRGVRVYNPHK